MKGVNLAGQETVVERRSSRRPVPPGPLSRRQVEDLQAIIMRGLVGKGYGNDQVGQIMNQSRSTVRRRLAGNPRPYV